MRSVQVVFDQNDIDNQEERARAWTPAKEAAGWKRASEIPTTFGSTQTTSLDEDAYKMLLREVLSLKEKDRSKWHHTISNSRNERVRITYVPPRPLHELSTVHYCLVTGITAQAKALRNTENDFLPLITAGMKLKFQLEMSNLPGSSGNIISYQYGAMNEAVLQQDEGERFQGARDYKAGVMTGNHEGRLNHHINVMPPVSSRK
jgi:hypothetical protein